MHQPQIKNAFPGSFSDPFQTFSRKCRQFCVTQMKSDKSNRFWMQTAKSKQKVARIAVEYGTTILG
eukprot:5935486-Pleurochrysis_carterae.AAC.1